MDWSFQMFFLLTLYFWWIVSSLSFDFCRSCLIFTVAIFFKKQPKRMPGTESVRSSRATNGSRVAPWHLPGFPSCSPSETNTQNTRTNIACKIEFYSQRGFLWHLQIITVHGFPPLCEWSSKHKGNILQSYYTQIISAYRLVWAFNTPHIMREKQSARDICRTYFLNEYLPGASVLHFFFQ